MFMYTRVLLSVYANIVLSAQASHKHTKPCAKQSPILAHRGFRLAVEEEVARQCEPALSVGCKGRTDGGG